MKGSGYPGTGTGYEDGTIQRTPDLMPRAHLSSPRTPTRGDSDEQPHIRRYHRAGKALCHAVRVPLCSTAYVLWDGHISNDCLYPAWRPSLREALTPLQEDGSQAVIRQSVIAKVKTMCHRVREQDLSTGSAPYTPQGIPHSIYWVSTPGYSHGHRRASIQDNSQYYIAVVKRCAMDAERR